MPSRELRQWHCAQTPAEQSPFQTSLEHVMTSHSPAQNTGLLSGRALITWLSSSSEIAKTVGFLGVHGLQGTAVPNRPRCARNHCGIRTWRTGYFNSFWDMPLAQAILQNLVFNKNLAIIGGLLRLAVDGGPLQYLGPTASRKKTSC